MKANYWMVPPEWYGETCFIVAGGPSVLQTRVSDIRGAGRVIAINNSYQLTPWADVLYFCDEKWWKQHGRDANDRFEGRYKITLENHIPGVQTMRNTGELGLETDPSGLRHGSNSGFQAINLAYHFGATLIILIGYDMKCAGEATHWHQGHGDPAGSFRNVLRVMLPKFESLVEPLAKAEVQVVNTSPASELKSFPFRSLSAVLGDLGETVDSRHTRSSRR